MKQNKNKNTDYYKDFSVTSVDLSERAVHISWKLPSRSISSETCIYRHSDGSWHLDGVSRQYGKVFADALAAGLAGYFCKGLYPADDDTHFAGDVSRMEYLLNKEENYHKALKNMNKNKKEFTVPKSEDGFRVSIWRTDDE